MTTTVRKMAKEIAEKIINSELNEEWGGFRQQYEDFEFTYNSSYSPLHTLAIRYKGTASCTKFSPGVIKSHKCFEAVIYDAIAAHVIQYNEMKKKEEN